jgi:hypothetical protein
MAYMYFVCMATVHTTHSFCGVDDNHESMKYRLLASEAIKPSPSFILQFLSEHTQPTGKKTQNRIREKLHDLSVRCGHSRPRPFTSQQNA